LLFSSPLGFRRNFPYCHLKQAKILVRIVTCSWISDGMLLLWCRDLSGNSLHGAIPAWIGGLTLLQRVDLSGNKFQGNIPFASNGSNATSYNLPYVVEISLGDNNLSGLLPDLDIFHGLRKL
jgi:hypothetical protein